MAFLEQIAFCYRRRDLLKYLVVSKLKLSRANLMLGYLWWIIEPFIMMIVYWLLIGIILRRGGPNYPLFILCGLFPFRVFSTSLNRSTTSITGNFGMIGLVNFPRVFLCVSDVIVDHVKLIFGFLILIVLTMIYGNHIGPVSLLCLFILMLLQLALISGLSMMLSIGAVYFRDLQNLMQFFVRLLLFLSPILYSLDRVPENFRSLYMLNPLAGLFISYRGIFMENATPSISLLSPFLVSTAVCLVGGYLIFFFADKKVLKLI